MMDTTILSIVNRYKDQIKQSGIPVDRVIVFGSQIQGTAHQWSDIDTCVISSVFGHDRQAERIEPHPYSPEDFANRFDPLANEIRKTGVTI